MTDNETPEFASILLNHAKGRAHDEASTKLGEAVDAVKQALKVAHELRQVMNVKDE